MKKQTILRVLLVLLPVLAVGLATTVDSVMVYDAQAGTTAYYSYFDVLPVEAFQVVPALAAMLGIVSGVLGAVYMAKRKEALLKAMTAVSFAAATVAVLPIVFRGEVLVVPNVGVPVFLIGQCLLAYYLLKNPDKEAIKVRRLDRT